MKSTYDSICQQGPTLSHLTQWRKYDLHSGAKVGVSYIILLPRHKYTLDAALSSLVMLAELLADGYVPDSYIWKARKDRSDEGEEVR